MEAFGIAGLTVVVLGVITWIATRRVAPAVPGQPPQKNFIGRLINGIDGRLSTSKFQWFVWTVMGLFAFCEVFTERLLRHLDVNDPSLPPYLLTAMGFSVATMSAAKGITSSYAASGHIDKSADTTPGTPGAPPTSVTKGGLMTDDDGVPDLSKIQMVSFTLVSLVVYLIHLIAQSDNDPVLVDIEPALMVLMGLSQGAYIGKKLTTIETPRVTGLSPATCRPGTPVTITGVNFGATQGGSMLTVEDAAVVPVSGTWTDQSIQFTWPALHTTGVFWKAGERALVSVVVNGREAPAPVPVSIAPNPRIITLTPTYGSAGIDVEIVGADFGTDLGVVKLDDLHVVPRSWSDRSIRFTLPPQRPNGTAWNPGDTITITVASSGGDVLSPNKFTIK